MLLYNTVRSLSTATNNTFAFAFDIDGVLLKSKRAIPEARKALQLLNGDNPVKRRIPFILLTNGGGVLESAKAAQVSQILGVEILPEQVVLAHSPMRMLAKTLGQKRVLVVGGQGSSCYHVAKSYGFTRVTTPGALLAQYPSIWPFPSNDISEVLEQHDIDDPVEAVMMLNDSRDWGRDMQIMLDVLTSTGGVIGTQPTTFGERVPLFFSNNDLIWSTDFPAPRVGQGAFKVVLESLYQALTGHTLHSTSFGKPCEVMYMFAQQTLRDLPGSTGTLPTRIYAVGDNPATDIRGANQLDHWTSILVRSGVFRGPGNDPAYPAHHVCDNVLDAVQWALEKEEGSI